MAKFRQGDLVLTASESIINGVVTIDEFSVDGTLSGNSDTTIPTEKAIKTYIDNKIDGSIWSGINNAIARYDSTSNIQTSGIFIDDSNNITSINSISLNVGATINEFSTDGTLLGDSDDVVPTEKAVKTYVDTSISSISISSISEGNSSIDVIDSTTSNINIIVDSSLISTFTSFGLQLLSGARIDEFSIDGTLSGNSDTAVPTEKAIKTYIDNKIIIEQWTLITYDYTAFSRDRLAVSTDSSAIIITLPTTPSFGDEIWILDAAINFGTNNCTLDGNGNNIEGASSDYVLDSDRADIELVYIDSTVGWRVKT